MKKFNRGLRTYVCFSAIAGIVLISITAVEVNGQGKKKQSGGGTSDTSPTPTSKTTLQAKGPTTAPWAYSLTIATSQKVTFRFSTSEPGAATAEWQISNKPFKTGSGATAAQAPNVIAKGSLGAVPASGQYKSFEIDFDKYQNHISSKPQGYWVFVVTKTAEAKPVGIASPSVNVIASTPLRVISAEASRDTATKVWQLKLKLNYLPTDGEITVQRLKNDPFPDVWWAKEKWIAGKSVRFLRPSKTQFNPSTPAWAFVYVNLPADIGAGEFQARVKSTKPDQTAEWEKFEIHYPPPADGELVLRYYAVESLEETDEVGADEILILAARKLSPDGFGSTFEAVRIGFEEDVDKGERHRRSKNVYVTPGVRTQPIAIAVVEVDDGHPTAYEVDLSALMRGLGPGAEEIKTAIQGKSGAALLRPVLEFALKRQDDLVANADDLVGVIDLPSWEEDVPECKKNENGVRREVIVEGDGGRFKLLFHLFARPKSPEIGSQK